MFTYVQKAHSTRALGEHLIASLHIRGSHPHAEATSIYPPLIAYDIDVRLKPRTHCCVTMPRHKIVVHRLIGRKPIKYDALIKHALNIACLDEIFCHYTSVQQGDRPSVAVAVALTGSRQACFPISLHLRQRVFNINIAWFFAALN